jgi:hypothetical protein
VYADEGVAMQIYVDEAVYADEGVAMQIYVDEAEYADDVWICRFM